KFVGQREVFVAHGRVSLLKPLVPRVELETGASDLVFALFTMLGGVRELEFFRSNSSLELGGLAVRAFAQTQELAVERGKLLEVFGAARSDFLVPAIQLFFERA